jgi:hypothetical protein
VFFTGVLECLVDGVDAWAVEEIFSASRIYSKPDVGGSYK